MISYNIISDHNSCLLIHHIVATHLVRHKATGSWRLQDMGGYRILEATGSLWPQYLGGNYILEATGS